MPLNPLSKFLSVNYEQVMENALLLMVLINARFNSVLNDKKCTPLNY